MVRFSSSESTTNLVGKFLQVSPLLKRHDTWHQYAQWFFSCIHKHKTTILNTPMCCTRVILYYIIYLKWLLIITNSVMLTHNKCDTSRPLDNLVNPFQYVYVTLITIYIIDRGGVSNDNAMVKLAKEIVFWAIRCSQWFHLEFTWASCILSPSNWHITTTTRINVINSKV